MKVTFDAMLDRFGSLIARFGMHGRVPSMRRAVMVAAALSLQWLATSAACAQANLAPSTQSTSAQAPAQQSAPVTTAPQADPAPPPREENPGLLNEIGKLFDKSKSVLPTLKTPQEAIEGATDNLSRLTTPSSMVTGRMSCPLAPNGAPDCKAAADKLCQSKGYKDGKSLNVDFAEKCSPKIYIPGHKREPGDCRADNYVTRALCQ